MPADIFAYAISPFRFRFASFRRRHYCYTPCHATLMPPLPHYAAFALRRAIFREFRAPAHYARYCFFRRDFSAQRFAPTPFSFIAGCRYFDIFLLSIFASTLLSPFLRLFFTIFSLYADSPYVISFAASCRLLIDARYHFFSFRWRCR